MRELVLLIQRHGVSLTLVNLTLVTLLSLWPLDQLPEFPGSDKSHHLIAWAAVVLPLALRRPQSWRLMVFGLAAWGGLIELLQPYVNRYSEWADVAANLAGMGIGLGMSQIGRRLIRPTPDGHAA